MGVYILLVREPSGVTILLKTPYCVSSGCLASYADGNIGTVEGCEFCSKELLSVLEKGADIYDAEQIYYPMRYDTVKAVQDV